MDSISQLIIGTLLTISAVSVVSSLNKKIQQSEKEVENLTNVIFSLNKRIEILEKKSKRSHSLE